MSSSSTLRRGFLNGGASRPPDATAPTTSTPQAPKRKDPPEASPDAILPPTRAAKTAATERIRQQAFPRAPNSNELLAVQADLFDKRRAAEKKVAAFIDRFLRDLSDLESSGALNTHSARLFAAGAHAAFKQALTPGAHAPPEVLIKALNAWDPADSASADRIRLHDSYAAAAAPNDRKLSFPRPPKHKAVKTRPDPPPLRPLQGFQLRGRGAGSAEEALEKASGADETVYVRLSSQHKMRTTHAYFLKKLAAEALKDADAPQHVGIDTIKHIPSGLALRPLSTCTAAELFSFHEQIKVKFSANQVEIGNQWDRFVVMNVPTFIDGEQVPDDIIADELTAAVGCPLPEPPRRLGRPEALSTQRSSSVLFSLPGGRMPADTTRLSLLGQRFSVRPYKEQRASEHCDHCLSQHHSTARCKAQTPRCKDCAAEGHSAGSAACLMSKAAQDSVQAIPRCYHCHGPHSAFSPGCFAAARYCKEVHAVTIPTGTRLARARQLGERKRKHEVARRIVAGAARAARQTGSATAQPTSGEGDGAATAAAMEEG